MSSPDDTAEALERAFFGLDEGARNMLEQALDGTDASSPTGTAAPAEEENFDDVLCGFSNEDDNNNNNDDGDMGAPSPSAGFGMLGGACGTTNCDEGKKRRPDGTSSSMWSGLVGVDGVEDGMGMREVSEKAAATGYETFLEEVALLKDIYSEEGDTEVIRAKPNAMDPRKQRALLASTAATAGVLGDSETEENKNKTEEEGPIIAVRVQLLPLRILEAFNKRVTDVKRSGTKVSGGSRFSKGLHVTATYVQGYPDRPPLVSVEPWHNLLPTNAVVKLNHKIVEILNANSGAPALMSTLMMIAQEAEELIDSYEEGDIRDIAAAVRGTGIRTRLISEAMHPDRYLGANLVSVLARLPKNIVVQCVENIMRTDLALQFEKMQRYLFKKNVEPYAKMKNIRTQQHIIEQAEAVPSFHGTRMSTVGYIVRDGLLVPGGDSGINVRCGSRFGNGIYSSPDPNFAAMYAERCEKNYKLILCATLLGKRDTSEWDGPLANGCDSRVADEGVQYIVFHRAQILPCYILHIKIFDPVTMQPVFPDLRHTLKAELRDVDAARDDGFFDKQEIAKRRKQILTQMARKNLPFGFGPRGVHFVVEAIADVSDEDEGFDCVERLQNNSAEELYQHESVIKNRYGTSHKHPTDL